MLGGGSFTSRLFQEAREKRGLAYAIDAYAESYADVGLTGVYAGAAAPDAPELMRVVAEQVRDLADRPGEAEVARAKVQMKSGLFMSRESLLSRAEGAAAQVHLFDRLLPPEEIAERIDAVTTDDVRSVSVPMSLSANSDGPTCSSSVSGSSLRSRA